MMLVPGDLHAVKSPHFALWRFRNDNGGSTYVIGDVAVGCLCLIIAKRSDVGEYVDVIIGDQIGCLHYLALA